MPLKSKSNVSRLNKKSRIELGRAIMTLKNNSRVCGKQEKGRMELGYALMTLKSKYKACRLCKSAEWSRDVHK